MIRFLIFVLFWAFLLPLALVEFMPSEIPQASIPSYLVILISTFQVYQCASKRAIASCVFWIYFYCWFGVAPFLQILNAYFPWGGVYSEGTIWFTSFLVLLSLLSFYFGYMMKVDKIWDRIKSKELANGRFVLFGLIMLLIAIAIIQNFVGLQSLFLPRNIMNGIIAADNSSAILSVVTTLYRAIPFVTFFIILYFVSNHPTLQFKLFFILSGIVFIVTSNPLSTPRYWFGSTFLAIGYFLLRKKILNISFSWFLLVTLSIVYPFSDVFRRSLLVKTSIFDRSILLSMQHGFVYKPDFNSFQMLMNSVEYVRDFGFFYGQQIFGALFFWVPRVLWSDKPESTGEIIAADRNYPITNLDSPLMSEGYVDFGIIGLICYMFIHGFLIKRLDRILIRDTGDVKYLFALFFSFYQIFFLRGTLMVAVSCLAPLVLIFLFYDKAVFKESRT